MKPLVSVVIPSYNHASYIGKALDSVCKQTYSNWEVIVVDNHSSDKTDLVLKDYANDKIRICKIHNEGVIAKSRNYGIKEAKGDWIAFLDSDDWWDTNKLQYCVEQINSDVALIYHDMWVYDGDQKKEMAKKLKSRSLHTPVVKDLLISGNCIINSSVVVCKKILEQVHYIDERRELITSEDYHCWLKISAITNGFLYIKKELGYYTIHQNGMSQREVIQQTREAVKEFLPILTVGEKNRAEAFIRYFKMVSSFNKTGGYKKEDLLFCVKYGSVTIKAKAILMMAKSFFR